RAAWWSRKRRAAPPAATGPPWADTCFRRTAAAPPPARPAWRQRARPNPSRCGTTCLSSPCGTLGVHAESHLFLLFPLWRKKKAGGTSTLRRPCSLFFRRGNQAAVHEPDLRRRERAAFGAAVQRIDGHLDLVARLQAFRGHPFTGQQTRRAAFE